MIPVQAISPSGDRIDHRYPGRFPGNLQLAQGVDAPAPKGYLAIVLHAHLPYVRHPEYPSFLEEDWLFEAITETYRPLLHIFERLCHDGVPWQLTMSLTPPLLSMFMDPLLQDRYINHLQRLMDLAEREVERTRYLPEYHGLAMMYRDNFHKAYDSYVHRYGRDLGRALPAFPGGRLPGDHRSRPPPTDTCP